MSLRAFFAKQSPGQYENHFAMFLHFRRGLLRPRFDSPALAPGASVTYGSAQRERARNDILILFFFFLTACAPSTPLATPQVVTVYSTPAAQPWLQPLYACGEASAVISRVDQASSADIILRVGEPEFLASPAYQIDAEDILIVTHRQSSVQNLTLEEARVLFAGQGDPTVQVWVYSSEEDVQMVFDQFVMEGRRVTASARVAVSPQQMSDTLINEANTVGILPRHWRAGEAREVFSVATVPVLAMTDSEPQGVIKELIACLQK